jgi:hypothetical protein
MDEIGKKDQNSATVLMGVTDDANQYIRMIRVDPITGRVLISNLGGGFTEITFTGAVDGVNTSFTGLQPTYMIIDGLWLKEFDNNSVRQWSWSGGILTTTLPPQSSVYGF